MPETRELAEAHSWSRRRLAEVLLAGPVALRGAEPRRPGRAIVGGVVLAALLLGGFAVVGLLRPQTADVGSATDLTTPGLLVVRATGAAYVVLAAPSGPVVRAVLNPTSARLLLGEEVEPRLVEPEQEDDLAVLVAEHPGPALGIPDAPWDLPAPASLVGRWWRACPEDGTVRVDLPAVDPRPLGPGTAVLVRGSAGVMLVLDAGGGARRLPLPAGSADAEALLSGIGAPPAAAAVAVSDAWLDLLPIDRETLPPLAVRTEAVCLVLVATSGRSPTLRLAAAPVATAAPLPPGSAALVAALDAAAPTDPADPADRADLSLVDDRGRALRLVGDVAERLGYARADPVLVPAAWLALLEQGPELSVEAAGRAVRR